MWELLSLEVENCSSHTTARLNFGGQSLELATNEPNSDQFWGTFDDQNLTTSVCFLFHTSFNGQNFKQEVSTYAPYDNW